MVLGLFKTYSPQDLPTLTRARLYLSNMTSVEIRHVMLDVLSLLNENITQGELLQRVYNSIITATSYRIPQEYKTSRERKTFKLSEN